MFIVCGALCGLVGVLWGARFGTVDAVIAPDLHLQAISAVVVGGVSIFGGSGSVYGAALGAVIFAVLQNGVQLLGINQFWLQAVTGAAILGTVIFYSLLTRRAERVEREARHQPVGPALPAAGQAMSRLGPYLVRWEAFLLLVLVITLVLGAGNSRYFLTASNLSIAVAGVMPAAIVALPMTLVIVCGEIDISVGSMVGLCAATIAVCREQDLSIETSMLASLVVGTLAGALNGAIIVFIGLPSLVVTIGTLALYRGIAQIMLKERGVTGFPDWYQEIGFGTVGNTPIPWSAVIFVAFFAGLRGVPACQLPRPGAVRHRQQP